MANPITWQNVGQGNFGDAANFMQLSMKGADTAFANATGRAKEQEDLTKAAKTNSIVNQIAGITDEETLRAFQGGINFEDMGVDSNVLTQAITSQQDRIRDNKLNDVNIRGREQDILASKAGVDLAGKEFNETVTQNAFDRTMDTNKDTRENTQLTMEQTRAGLENTGLQQQNDLGARQIDELKAQDRLNANVGEALVMTGQGMPREQAVAKIFDPKRPLQSMQAIGQFQQGLLDIVKLDPAQTADVVKAGAAYDVEIARATADLTKAEEKFKRQFPVEPPDVVTTADELNGSGITKAQVVEEWLGNITKANPDAGLDFRDQSNLLGARTRGNMGYGELIKQVNDPKGSLNTSYKEALIANAEKLGLNIDPSTIEPIDPALLKQALGSVTLTDGWQDGVDANILVKAAVEAQTQRFTRKAYDAKREEMVGANITQLQKLANQKIKTTQEAIQAYELKNAQGFQKAVTPVNKTPLQGNVLTPQQASSVAFGELGN